MCLNMFTIHSRSIDLAGERMSKVRKNKDSR